MGSYPVIGQGVFVSLIGCDRGTGNGERLSLGDVAKEVEVEVGGKIVSEEEVARKKEEVRAAKAAVSPQSQQYSSSGSSNGGEDQPLRAKF